ncbi:MAG: hypothetical protein ACLRIS_18515 [Flavonifractor plautii]
MRSEGRWTCEQHGAHGPGAAGAVQPLLGGAPPGSAGRTAAGSGRGRRGRPEELNAQIGAAELADGAKGTVRTWQELRVGSKGGYAALSPEKGRPSPGRGNAAHLEGKARVQKQVTRWLERGHGTRRPAAGSSRSWNQAGRAGVTRASAAGYVKGRQFYSWTKAKALELALKAADRVLSRIADEVDY